MASESDLAGYGKYTLRSLKLPVLKGDVWALEETPLIPPPGEQFWTEHSECNFLTTHGVVLKIAGEDLDRLGRWKIKGSESGSENYQRAFKLIVRKIQRQMVEAWKSREFKDDVEELELGVRSAYSSFLEQKGIGKTAAQ